MTDVSVIVEMMSLVLACLGTFFFVAGTVGLLRFPDFYCRTHAATKCDTLGAGLLIVALILRQGIDPQTLKLVALLALIAVYSPTSGHALARASYRIGIVPWRRDQ